MKTKTIYNIETGADVATAITGTYSGVGVYVMNDVIATLGGIETAFHEIKRLENLNFLPRMGGEGHPITLRDMALARENERLGKRHWRWYHLEGSSVHASTGYDVVYGYGYAENEKIIIVDAHGKTVYQVNYDR
ncbi:MAG TPA: hypothetical protein DCZ08_03565 [Anaerolineaceae bacterium]|nr:hypothetical protein [Anaerolineaceae bacterium]